MNVAKNIAIIILILLLLGLAVKQQLDLNTLNDECAALEAELAELTHENDRKQSELELSEEERLQKEAKKSGYRDPDATYYYNDQNNPE